MSTPSRWWSRWHRWANDHPDATDALFALAVGALTMAGFLVAETVGSQRDPDWIGAALIVAQTAAFAFRRRFVWWSLAGVIVFTTTFWVADYATNFEAISVLAFYAATAHGGDDRQLVWRRVAVGVAIVAAVAVAGVLSPDEELPAIAVVGIVAIYVTGAFIGEAVYERRCRMAELESRAERAEAERELLARQAVLDERSRISREMHDIVAHSMSVMVVQAGAAERLVETDPGAAKQALATIGSVGRDSLAEMRRILGVLRAGDGASLGPQPSLDDVEALVHQCCESGLPTTVTLSGDRAPLSAGQDVAAYRIVQEALTNALKHAGPGAHASVQIEYRPDEVRIEVVDDGLGTTTAHLDRATGQGLVGMRERTEMFDGTLRAGPRPGGGFRVLATMPLRRVAADAEASA